MGGNIQNEKLKLPKDSRVIGFEMHEITIAENEHYQEVHMTMRTLSERIKKEHDTYKLGIM